MPLRKIFSSVKDDIVPAANVSYDLGNTTNQWKDLYLSGNTLNIGGASISVDANSGYVVMIPKPTESEANPKATVISANGVATVETTGGVVNTSQVSAAAGNTVSAGSGSGGGGVTWDTVQTANVTAVSNYGYPIDTTSSSIYMTLPSNPAAGDIVAFVDYAGTFSNNSLIITSSDNINGTNNNFTFVLNRTAGELVYIDSTQGWVASSSDLGKVLVTEFTVDYIIVAGGGAAGGSQGTSIGSGGGGGGGVISNSAVIEIGANTTFAINSIGAGGVSPSAGFTTGGSGGNTSVTIGGVAYVAIGGGGGGSWQAQASSGGSGGGAGENGQGYGPGSGTTGQGYAGGDDSGYSSGGESAGGGGGGASAAGSNTASTSVGGNGGDGINFPSGSVFFYGGGGGGAGSTTAGNGGAGGGGNGRQSTTGRGTNGTAGLGGGGGGSLTNASEAAQYGGDGGSGAFVIAYDADYPELTSIAGTLTYTANTTAVSGKRIYTFTAGTGNIVF